MKKHKFKAANQSSILNYRTRHAHYNVNKRYA